MCAPITLAARFASISSSKCTTRVGLGLLVPISFLKSVSAAAERLAAWPMGLSNWAPWCRPMMNSLPGGDRPAAPPGRAEGDHGEPIPPSMARAGRKQGDRATAVDRKACLLKGSERMAYSSSTLACAARSALGDIRRGEEDEAAPSGGGRKPLRDEEAVANVEPVPHGCCLGLSSSVSIAL
jgi:hypothetical protein